MFNLHLFKKEKSLDLKNLSFLLQERKWDAKFYNNNSIIININYFNTYKRLRNGRREKYSFLTLQSNGSNIDIIDEQGYKISTVSQTEVFSEIMDICNIISTRNFEPIIGIA